MYIIPAIDILNGKVVRLREGDYDQITSYDVTLEEMIDKYQSNGTEIIHIIDLNGAKGDFSNQKFLFDMIKKTDIKVQYGGGVRSIEKVKELKELKLYQKAALLEIHNPIRMPKVQSSKSKVKQER